jgi:hypothetical protein
MNILQWKNSHFQSFYIKVLPTDLWSKGSVLGLRLTTEKTELYSIQYFKRKMKFQTKKIQKNQMKLIISPYQTCFFSCVILLNGANPAVQDRNLYQVYH